MSLNSFGITLHESIGRGAFGDVYKCTYKGKKCALKQIKLICDHKALQMIGAEVEIMKKMDHPRIVKFFKFFNCDNKWNIVLEFMSGGSLAKLLETRKTSRQFFSQDKILLYFQDMAEGVAALHKENIIHRDLKPDNILIDEHNRLKLADFGIAKMMPGNHDLGAINQTITGTRSYWAPELARHVKYDISVDIWSLGVIFFEMALLEHPYGGVRLEQNDHKIMNKNFSPPKIPESRYSRTLIKMLDNFMQYEPSRRIKAKKFVEFLKDYAKLKQGKSSSSISSSSASNNHRSASSSSFLTTASTSSSSSSSAFSTLPDQTGYTLTPKATHYHGHRHSSADRNRNNNSLTDLETSFQNLNFNHTFNHYYANKRGDNNIFFEPISDDSCPSDDDDIDDWYKRLATFRNWPGLQSPEKMTDAGFYYTGVDDTVKCCRCKIIINRWEPDDHPWSEHLKWNPYCSFVAQHYGTGC